MWPSTFRTTPTGTFASVIGRERKVRRRSAQTGGLRSPTGEALLSWGRRHPSRRLPPVSSLGVLGCFPGLVVGAAARALDHGIHQGRGPHNPLDQQERAPTALQVDLPVAEEQRATMRAVASQHGTPIQVRAIQHPQKFVSHLSASAPQPGLPVGPTGLPTPLTVPYPTSRSTRPLTHCGGSFVPTRRAIGPHSVWATSRFGSSLSRRGQHRETATRVAPLRGLRGAALTATGPDGL